MSIAIFAPTPQGYQLAVELAAALQTETIWTRPLAPEVPCLPQTQIISRSLSETVAEQWTRVDACLFVLALGATVRLIAPLLTDKTSDPGVVTVDEQGRWVISVTGGHRGRANVLASQVAACLGVDPVITSASEGHQLPGLDVLGDRYGWRRGSGDWKGVAAAMTQGRSVQVVQTCGWDLWQQSLPRQHPFEFENAPATAAQLWISDQLPPQDQQVRVCWHPRTLWIGVGCERGTSADLIEAAIHTTLAEHDLAVAAIAGFATLELKQDEVALQTLIQRHHWALRIFTADALAQQSVPHPSAVVREAVGTPSVAEAASLLAAQSDTLLVSKQVFRGDQGACTLAVARASQELNPRPGRLWLVGTGPGDLSQLTAAARIALVQADVIIGYQRYVDLIQPLWQPGQVVEASPITQEQQRAERAIALAQRGLQVAVISSGDCGIYGMAGLVLECLVAQHWDGRDPDVEVLPGITALQAAAARVGAPLMHDFCAISLSDLLTPWPVIEQRLQAAATADFVVALYNPRSSARTEAIQIAQQILLQHRPAYTPVLLARSVYRGDETLKQTTLAQMPLESIDMLTVVLIGNSSTFTHRGWLITPRGYQVSPTPI
jgi:cobalt-precorrin 5A hydrolase/precorrin-3B C17-methyltransferase